MSHYVVAVVTKNHPDNADFDAILERYDENKSVPRYVSKTKEQIIKAEREHRETYKDIIYARYLADPVKYAETCNNPHHIEYVSKTFPNEIMKLSDEELYLRYISGYPSEEEMDEEEKEYGEYVDKDGNLTSTYNPNSKWDWWVIGGRWSDSLPLKNGGYADFARISDVAWGNDVDVNEYIKEHPEAKTKYETLITKGDFFKPEYYKDMYPSLEQYVKDQVQFIPFAIVTVDGEWHEKGEMGWFGCSSATGEDSINWTNSFYDTFIKNEDQDYYVTLIDCHI